MAFAGRGKSLRRLIPNDAQEQPAPLRLLAAGINRLAPPRTSVPHPFRSFIAERVGKHQPPSAHSFNRTKQPAVDFLRTPLPFLPVSR
jgi:hypothetical protein